MRTGLPRTSSWLRCLTTALAILISLSAARAQAPEPDPAALKAFAEMVKVYREAPALEVKTTVKIEMLQGDITSQGSEVAGEFIFAPGRKGVVKLRGYTCWLTPRPGNDEGGTVSAIHEATDHSYWLMADDGSPYYALLTGAFMDLPFPELALALGEDAIDDVLMQFHPKAPWLQPTAVGTIEKDGKTFQKITLTSDGVAMDVLLDPQTKLIQSTELQITGGDLVQEGTTLVYRSTSENTLHEKPLEDSVFVFDPGPRQRVDMIASLMPKPDPQVMPDGPEQPDAALVGKPAPPVVLATADGKAFDLEKLRGRVVVLDFWASWCPPCMQGLPLLHEVAKWADEAQLPITVMTVNMLEIRGEANTPDARLASALKTWNAKGFTLPIAMDYTDEVGDAYGVTGIPTTVVIRSDGVVHAYHSDVTAVETLKGEIEAALKAVEPGM